MAARWLGSCVISRRDTTPPAIFTLQIDGDRTEDTFAATWAEASAPGTDLETTPDVAVGEYANGITPVTVRVPAPNGATYARVVSLAWEGLEQHSMLVVSQDSIATRTPLRVFRVTEDTTTVVQEVLVVETGTGGSGGSGTVTSVAITGANGISVSGSPITDAGTIALSVDAATLRAHLDVLTSGQIATTLEDYVTATGLSTTLEDYALASSVPTEPGDIGAAAAAHSHVIADVTGLQTALDGKAASSHIHSIANVTGLQTALNARLVAANNLSDLPSASDARTNLGLAAVAASGDYGDLANTPTLATVATTGSYDDLSDTPSLGTAAVLDAGVANGAATLDSSGVLPAEQLTAHALTAHSDWVGSATPAAGMAVVVVSLSGLGDVPQFDVRDLTAADIKSGTLAVARGGTGGGDAATARTNLGAIGNASGSGATITGVWVGSQAEYDLLTPSADVLYFVEEE